MVVKVMVLMMKMTRLMMVIVNLTWVRCRAGA
jgi:hypothetical protein